MPIPKDAKYNLDALLIDYSFFFFKVSLVLHFIEVVVELEILFRDKLNISINFKSTK
jgi:hypothetical protein